MPYNLRPRGGVGALRGRQRGGSFWVVHPRMRNAERFEFIQIALPLGI